MTKTMTRTGWWRAGLAVAAVGWGANQFAPLLLLYRSELHLSTVAVAAAFGLYALGLMPGLLLGGPVSDRVGRRPVVVIALVVSLLASVLLIAGGDLGVAWLFAGRLVAGIASGAAFSSGAAWVKELAPEGGARRLTVAMTAGFAGGPLVAGLLAQWAPLPTLLPYLPHLVLTASAVPLALRTPETATRQPGTPLLRVAGVGDRRFRTVVVPLAPWVFGSASVALAYLPGLVSDQLLFATVVITLGALAGIAVQPLARRVDDPERPARLIATSLGIVLAGLLVAAAAAATMALWLVIVAGAVVGSGYGACQVCGLQEVQRLARPDNLAGLTAVYQAVSYIGFAVPFVLAACEALAPPAVLLLVLALLALLTMGWTCRRTS